MADIRIPNGIMTVQDTYKAGDLPPEGYLAWHEWAEVQRKAGIKQVACGRCGKWKTPQELSAEIDDSLAYTYRGEPVLLETPICAKCMKQEAAHD